MEFSTTDLHNQNMEIECPSSENKRYCFDDSSSYICQNGYDLITDHYISYEDTTIIASDGSNEQVTIEKPITDTKCVNNCTLIDNENKEHVFMRLPNIKIDQSDSSQVKKISHDLCTYECNPDIVESCPSEHGRDIKDFKCQNSSYSFFYQCLD
jgi:ribosomal protein S27E